MQKMRRTLWAALCAALLLCILSPAASAAGISFTDTAGHWAESYIQTCAGRGIVEGVGGGRFNPEGPVTNAAFVKMLAVAFYDTEERAYEAEHGDAMDAYFGGSAPWYGYRSYYFKELGLLEGVQYDIAAPASANAAMDRYNMAQVVANVLAQQKITADEEEKAVTQADLTRLGEYDSIPENYRDAVKTCYALGIIQGTSGGWFNGAKVMSRAQACTVITRLLDVVAKAGPERPTTVGVRLNRSEKNVGYIVDDNGYPTGTLNNGQPITEENVLELLEEAQRNWPAGTVWGDDKTLNTGFYQNPGAVVSGTISTGHHASVIYGCGGYVAAVSDYLFGKTQNPLREVTDLSKVRAGDIVIDLEPDGETAARVWMVASSVIKAGDPDNPNDAGRFWATEGGGQDGLVMWPDYESGAPTSFELIKSLHPDAKWAVYTRYPD